jgi:hypothetical protein
LIDEFLAVSLALGVSGTLAQPASKKAQPIADSAHTVEPRPIMWRIMKVAVVELRQRVHNKYSADIGDA